MASVHRDEKSGKYRIQFRLEGRQYQRSLKTTKLRDARAILGRVDETIRLVELGRLEIPEDIDPAAFVLADGKLDKPKKKTQALRLKDLIATYQESLPPGAKEPTTLQGEQLHFKHLFRHFGLNRLVSAVKVVDVQKYVADRLQESYRGRPISVDTIRKEIATFRMVWNWALAQERLEKPCPTRGVKYPKRDAKPPFMTWEEIERRVARGVGKDERKQLWDCLFLSTVQIEEVLTELEDNARHQFIFPLFLFAAHTGARRSEMLRSQVDDFDFDLGIVHIREKKRSRSQSTTFRRVPMSNRLSTGMQNWFAAHPGGQFTLTEGEGPITPTKATNHFRLTLRHTQWDSRLRGYHVFRHSFASNTAAAGIDPGMIDSWMGHQTEEMRNRYRHLFPKQQQTAIDLVFG
jgi:integrase